MNPSDFQIKTQGSDARYVPYAGNEKTYFELFDISAVAGETPGVLMSCLDENGLYLPSVALQNLYPNSDTGYGETHSNQYPSFQFVFGAGSKYLTHRDTPPNTMQIFGQPSDAVQCGIPDGQHYQFVMVFRRHSLVPPPSGGGVDAKLLAAAFRAAAQVLDPP